MGSLLSLREGRIVMLVGQEKLEKWEELLGLKVAESRDFLWHFFHESNSPIGPE